MDRWSEINANLADEAWRGRWSTIAMALWVRAEQEGIDFDNMIRFFLDGTIIVEVRGTPDGEGFDIHIRGNLVPA